MRKTISAGVDVGLAEGQDRLTQACLTVKYYLSLDILIFLDNPIQIGVESIPRTNNVYL